PSQTPTRPCGGDVKPPDGSPISLALGDSGDNLNLEQVDFRLEDTSFEKGVRRNRARVPPEISQRYGLGDEVKAGTVLKTPAGAAGSKRRKGSASSIHHWPADKKLPRKFEDVLLGKAKRKKA
ncbi:MAG: hypothetical protein Q9224_007450, partial [Gallowayella concinna]